MSDPLMTDKTPVSLGLVIYLVGLAVMTAGAWAWMQADVNALKAEAQDHADTSTRLDRLEMLMCVTDDAARARACNQLGVLR